MTRFSLLALTVAALGFTACGTSTPTPAPTPQAALTWSGSSTTSGASVTIVPSGFSGALTFTVSPSAAGSVSFDGTTATFTSRADFSGSVTITATSGAQSASVTLTITPVPNSTLEVRGTLRDVDGSSPTLTKPWSNGTGTLTAIGSNMQGGGPLGTGAVSANGDFVVTLRAPSPSDLLPIDVSQDPSCTGSITFSDPAARLLSLLYLEVRIDRGRTTAMNYDFVSGSANVSVRGEHLYADRPLRISGTRSCGSVDSREIFTADASLRAGWNVLRAEVTQTKTSAGRTTAIRYVNGDVPSTWITTIAGLPGSVQSLASHLSKHSVK